MKLKSLFATVVIVTSAIVLIGCNRGTGRVGDAPRTVSATSDSAWQEVKSSGIALQFPSDWKLLDVTAKEFDSVADKVFGNDPKFEAARSQAKAMAKQGQIKIFAFEPNVTDNFRSNCNVLVKTLPANYTIEQIGEASAAEIRPFVASGTQPKLEYISVDSGKCAIVRSVITAPNPAVPQYVSLGFVFVKGTKIAVITFSTALSRESEIRKIADKAVAKFRFTD